MRSDPRRHQPGTYPWTAALDTRFGDMDPNRHLNNVAVMRLYEEARVRFHGMLRAAYPALGRPRVLGARGEVDYLGEGRYPAPVEVGLGVASFGTSSYRAALALFQDGGCIGLCDTVIVYRGEAGPAPLPGELRSALGEWTVRG